MKKLTEEQNRCLDIVRDRGCIIRYPGGFWQRPHATCDAGTGDPVDAVGTGTITALVNRDYLSVAGTRSLLLTTYYQHPVENSLRLN